MKIIPDLAAICIN